MTNTTPIVVRCHLIPEGMRVQDQAGDIDTHVNVTDWFVGYIEQVFNVGPFDDFYLWLMPQVDGATFTFKLDKLPKDKFNSVYPMDDLS
jgi:hypothetical protein